MIKRMLITAVALSLVVGMSPQSANAKTLTGRYIDVESGLRLEEPASPMWTNVSAAKASVGVSGRTVTASVNVSARNNHSVSGNMFLERYNGRYWEIAGNWYVSGNGIVTMSRSMTGTSGKRYRTRFNGYVGSDWINITSNEAYVW